MLTHELNSHLYELSELTHELNSHLYELSVLTHELNSTSLLDYKHTLPKLNG